MSAEAPKPGAAGLARARARFGNRDGADQATGDTSAGVFSLELLLGGHGAVGRAHAAARRGDASARQALTDLRRAVAGITNQETEQ